MTSLKGQKLNFLENVIWCTKQKWQGKLMLGLFVGTYFAIVDYLDGCPLNRLHFPFISSIIASYIIWTSSEIIGAEADKRFTWEEQPKIKAIFLMSLNITVVIASLYFVTSINNFIKGDPFQMKYFYKSLVPSILITVVVNLTFIIMDFFKSLNESKLEVEKLKKENLRSQLESLKNQVNPHFLFNSLNTLISIIDEDKETAKNFVQELSRVYRYTLQAKEKDISALEEELKYLESYIFLLKIRYGDNLHFEVNIPDNLMNSGIPPLTLQMLVENAIKHNVISASKPLKVEIYTEESGHLIVRNNLQKKKNQVDSNKVGLSNIYERYSMVTPEPVEATQSEAYFIVALPLLTNNI